MKDLKMSAAPVVPIRETLITPSLIEKAIAWAEAQSASIAQAGSPLDDTQLALAAGVGVQHPDRIRIVEVQRFPMPDDPELRQAALDIQFLGDDTLGLTLGYGVCIRQDHKTNRLLTHEFRHVYQYEQAGSIRAFLPKYFLQVVTLGYRNAPFEVDARAYERDHA